MDQETPRRGRGRPPESGAMSGAERQAALRDRKGARTLEIGRDLLRAKQAGDWSAVERLAQEVMRL